MPRQSNGSYVAPANTSAVPLATISSTAFNTLETDIGNEITNSVDRQGRSPMQANLPMGGYRATGAGDPSSAQDYVTLNYANSNYLASTANSVTNDKLATAPVGTVKGVPASAATSSSAVTITIASPAVVTWAGHGLAADTPVVLLTTGALPTGLSANTVYYVSSPATNTFQLAATKGGTAINTSGSQSGTHTAYAYATGGESDLTMTYLGQQVTPGIPLPSFAVNLKIANNGATPDTKVDVTCDACTIGGATGNGRHSAVSVTINLTTTGANALDTGALASGTWYNIFLISTGTGVAGLASTSATPTLPATYLYYVRLGAVQTDGSTKLYRTVQRGTRTQYAVTAGSNTASMWMLNNANTGNITTPTYTGFQVTGATKAAPTTATAIAVTLTAVAGAGGSTMVAPNSAYGNSTSVTNPAPMVVTSIAASQSHLMILESNSIYIASNNAALSSVLVSGWVDSVPAV